MYSGGVSDNYRPRQSASRNSPRVPAARHRVGAIVAAPAGSRPHGSRGRPFGASTNAPILAFAIFLVLSGIGAALLTIRLHNNSVAGSSVSPFSPASRALVLVLDGADPALLRSVPMPNLTALEQNGVTYSNAWIGQTESSPAASAATIGTGSLPRDHGVVGDVWFDAAGKKVVRPALPDSVVVGSIDGIMEPTGIATLASDIKSQRPAARILSVGGTNCASAAAAATWVADFIVCATRGGGLWSPVAVAGHELPRSASAALAIRTRVAQRGRVAARLQGWLPGGQDDWITREAIASLKATHPVITYVTFPEIAVLRRGMPATLIPALQRQILRGLDSDIGRIVRELKREGEYTGTVVAVTSGRAFSPIHARMTFSGISSAIVAAGGQATYIAGDGSAFIGLRDPLQAQPVAQALQAEGSQNVDAVYYKSGSGTSWSYAAQYLNPTLTATFDRAASYLLSSLASAGAPDVVVVYRPGAGLTSAVGANSSFGSLSLQWPNQHIPLIVAGHGVYAGRSSTFPARLVDIAPTLETALGLPVTARDGTVLRDALYGTIAGHDEQPAVRARLLPLVNALRERSSGVAGR